MALDEDSIARAAEFVSVAKARCSDAFMLVGNEGVQMHGGIGMTDEHDIGFFLNAPAPRRWPFGDAAFHRDRFAALQGTDARRSGPRSGACRSRLGARARDVDPDDERQRRQRQGERVELPVLRGETAADRAGDVRQPDQRRTARPRATMRGFPRRRPRWCRRAVARRD